MIHILKNNDDHYHVHDNENIEPSHFICLEDNSEKQLQQDFDLVDPNTADSVLDEIAHKIEHRHEHCHVSTSMAGKGHKATQLSLTHLRSCRQIYLEANKVHYTDNSFAIFCNDILERFVKLRFRNNQHLDIRSLYLDISIVHARNINLWSESISKAVVRRLKSVRCLHLNLVQLYCRCTVNISRYHSKMAKSMSKMSSQLSKLPLREVTLIIDDSEYRKMSNSPQHLWTLKRKQDFSKKVREILLG